MVGGDGGDGGGWGGLFDDLSNDLRARFLRFHRDHPEVYRKFRGFAIELRSAGFERGSAKMIWERLRWETAVARGGKVLNNDFTACYARMLAEDEPRMFGSFFEFRASRALGEGRGR